ncbi:hypothetical protein [Paenibacillus sambharensis]|uniref:hypothetical protein n=1 Tax=Paenibacillus sambharensis TaxID=1803190 RepID=UPI0015E88252|nr:hypothetical protein [Paenibacillus sambharensis]
MGIQIHKKNKIMVTFTCPIGEGIGVWKSQEKVFIGTDVDVELDVSGILIFNQDVVCVEEKEEKIYLKDNQVHIRGRIEQIEWDNILTVRLGKSILLIEVEDIAIYEVDKWIEIKTKELDLSEVIF